MGRPNPGAQDPNQSPVHAAKAMQGRKRPTHSRRRRLHAPSPEDNRPGIPPHRAKNPSPKTIHVAPGSRRPSTTKKKASHSVQGRQRAPRPYHYGPPDRHPDLAHPAEFRFALVRASGEIVELRHVESATWDDTNAIEMGTLTFREPTFDDDPTPVPVQGDRVICQANEGGGWREVWMMRVYKPQLAAENRQYTYNLANDLDLLRQSQGYFKYVGDKAHPRGWYGHEIIADVCEKFHIPVGALYRGTKRRQRLIIPSGQNALGSAGISPLEVIRNQVKWEVRHGGPRLVVSFQGGKLYVLPLRRSRHLLQLGPTLTQAAFSSELPAEFGSAVIVRGIVPELFPGGNKQKGHVKLESAASRKRFGYVQRVVFSPDATTDADLRKEGLAYLTVIARPIKHLTMTHQGMPFIRRGDAIQLALGNEGIRRQVVWVYEATHELTADGYTMQLTVIFDDPYIDFRAEKLIFKLKGTKEEAVGNRAQHNATWYVGSQKDDLPKQSRQSDIFSRAEQSVGGRAVGN
jgi:hypothetical protein